MPTWNHRWQQWVGAPVLYEHRALMLTEARHEEKDKKLLRKQSANAGSCKEILGSASFKSYDNKSPSTSFRGDSSKSMV